MQTDRLIELPQLSDFVPDGGIYRIYRRLTVRTHTVVSGLTFLWTIPGFILVPIFTLIGGILTGIPGVGLVFWLPVEALLWALQSSLKGSSRLWENVPLLRLPRQLAVSRPRISIRWTKTPSSSTTALASVWCERNRLTAFLTSSAGRRIRS